MFDLVDNVLCVPATVLYEEMGLISYDNYKWYVRRGKLKKVVNGGNGRKAMIDYASMPDEFKMALKSKCGNKSPWQVAMGNDLKMHIEQDLNAIKYFNEFVKPDGEKLSEEKKREYIANANILNAVDKFLKYKNGWGRNLGSDKRNRWETISEEVNAIRSEEIPHKLPQKPRPLRNKFDRYKREGYDSLVHGGTGNSNTEKLSLVAKSWLIARWATPIEKVTMTQLWEEFNDLAEERGWKPLDDQKTIRNYLYQPEIKVQWYGNRYGELQAKEKYGYQHSTKLPTMRDSLWYSDGTKLNLYYLEDGKVQTTSVYEVIDAYSEVFVGFHISKSEDFTAQYSAFKMAVQFSGHRPYEVRYDNQGGHKKLQSGNFLTNLSRLSIRTQPYNGKSKTIENAFYRFQASYLHKEIGFTGQNITTKKLESKANMEFILANTDNLPSYDEAVAAYIRRRNDWNNAKHPVTGQPRIEMYMQSENPKAPAIDFLDMVDLFWMQREKPVTYKAYGLTMTHKKQDYTYAKYDENRLVDMKWHTNNIDRKFVVKFDPDDMSSICVFKESPSGLQFVAQLDQKIEVHRGKQEAEEWEASFLASINKANKVARVETRDKTNEVLEKHGLLPEQHGYRSPAIKGIETGKAKKRMAKKVPAGEIGQYDKEVSNMVPDIDDKEALYKKIY